MPLRGIGRRKDALPVIGVSEAREEFASGELARNEHTLVIQGTQVFPSYLHAYLPNSVFLEAGFISFALFIEFSHNIIQGATSLCFCPNGEVQAQAYEFSFFVITEPISTTVMGFPDASAGFFCGYAQAVRVSFQRADGLG